MSARRHTGLLRDQWRLTGLSLAPDHPLPAAAVAVVERTTGRRQIPTRAGGTLPITSIFKEMLGLDTLEFGFAMPDEDAHAPNEFFRISYLQEGAARVAVASGGACPPQAE